MSSRIKNNAAGTSGDQSENVSANALRLLGGKRRGTIDEVLFRKVLMNNFLLNILISGGVSAVLASTLVFLSKTWLTERLKNSIKHEYDVRLETNKAQLKNQADVEMERLRLDFSTKLETHKTQLKAQADVETERLRSRLSITAHEQQVRFAGLQNRRAEVIAEVYGLFVQAYWDTASFASPVEWNGEPDKKEKYRDAMNSCAAFFQYFEKHRIYLPHESAVRLEKFVREMRTKAIRFGTYIKFQDEGLPEHVYKQKHDAWESAWEYFENEFPAARLALEKDLRDLLGGPAQNLLAD